MPAEKPVYVVDDDAAVRRSLERLLDSAGFKAISYATPMAFLDAVPGLSGGCVLLDLRMPGLDGLAVQAWLAKLESPIPVIVMTGQGDVQAAVRAMKAGAVDFLEKPFDDDTLLNAIEAALTRSERPNRDSEVLEAAERLAALSPREREVLDALIAGRSNKVIAYDLGISVRTVEVHRARMMDRLGVRQLAEAIRLAVMARMAPHATGAGRPKSEWCLTADPGGLAVALLECIRIDDLQRSRPGEFDDSALLQIGERTAHCLDRYGQVVRDVIAGNGQCHAIVAAVRRAARHIQEERANLLDRGNAAERQELHLQARHRFDRHLAKFAGGLRIRVHQQLRSSAWVTGDDCSFHDSLNGELIFVAGGKSKEIARQEQTEDLAAAIGPQCTLPRRAG